MKTRIIAIGNSQGIRIPKPLLAQCNLSDQDEVELIVEGDRIIIKPLSQPRQGWEQSMQAMATAEDDHLLIDSLLPTEWDETEWQW